MVGKTDYAEWLKNVRSLVKSRHPGVDPGDLDPVACQAAYKAGVAPIFFVTQAPLPLRQIVPAAPVLPVAQIAPGYLGTQRRKSKMGPFAFVVTAVLIGAVGFFLWTQQGRSGNQSIIPPTPLSGPQVLSVAATSTEDKASYSDTTWVHVNWFRIVSPDRIESKEDGPWTTFLKTPPGSRPVGLAACRTMEKESYSTTTWVKVHLFLLTNDGSVWESSDGAPFTQTMQTDGKDVVGLAAASFAEKESYSDTTWWKVTLFRLLADGSIESSDDGGPWTPLKGGDGRIVRSISAASSKEKQSYSTTTWWTVHLFRLLDDGTVEVSDSGGPWMPHSKQASAVNLAAYTVETKEAYSDTTWEDVRVEGFSNQP